MSSLGNTYDDLQLEGHATISRDAKLAASHLSPVDGYFQHDVDSLHRPQQPKNYRHYVNEHIDIPFSQPSTAPWGQNVSVSFGNNGLTVIRRVELIAKIDGDGVSRTNAKLKDWWGELMIGDEFAVRYNQNTVIGYGANFLHAYNRKRSVANSAADAAYQTMVGAVGEQIPASGSQLTACVPLLMPFQEDASAGWFAAAAPRNLALKFRVPTYASMMTRLDARDGTVLYNDSYAAGTAPTLTLYLRVHGSILEAAERLGLGKLFINGEGITKVFHDTTELSYVEQSMNSLCTGTAATDFARTQETLIDLSPATLACPWLLATCRYKRDLADASMPSTFAGVTMTVAGDRQELLAHSEFNPSPQPFAYQPVKSWKIKDGQNNFTPVYAYKHFEYSIMPRHLRCETGQHIACVFNTEHPLAEQVGAGHVTWSSLNVPKLAMTSELYPQRAIGTAAGLGWQFAGDSDPFTRKVADSALSAADATHFAYTDFPSSSASVGAGITSGGALASETNTAFDRRYDVYCIVKNMTKHVDGDYKVLFNSN